MIAITVAVEATIIEIGDDLKHHLHPNGLHPLENAKLLPDPQYEVLLGDNSSIELPHAIKVLFNEANRAIEPTA